MWAVGVGALLAMFYVLDARNYRRAPREVRAELAEPPDRWRFEGLGNLVFLAVILGAVFLNRPLFLREALMVAAALGSYYTTRPDIHHANHFNFHPIREVAVLFAGIFATMMPALDWLQGHAQSLMGPHPAAAWFYWGTGALSSVLDNAPTYLSFLSAILGGFVDGELIRQVQHLAAQPGADLGGLSGTHAEAIRRTLLTLQNYHGAALTAGTVSAQQIAVCYLLANAQFSNYILAVSIGAVFFGACTYIGNGPNFMVKSIADHERVHTPSFLGYLFRFTLPYLLPALVLVWLLFFRR